MIHFLNYHWFLNSNNSVHVTFIMHTLSFASKYNIWNSYYKALQCYLSCYYSLSSSCITPVISEIQALANFGAKQCLHIQECQ